MGGADTVLRKARASFAAGDYRWVAEVVNHVVFADPNNMAARNLLADAYEQMGYQSESGPWRNVYLAGAQELRAGVRELPAANAASPDTIRAMPFSDFLDFCGVRLNPDKAGTAKVEFNVTFNDLDERWTFGVENSAIHYTRGRHAAAADASVTTTRAAFNDVMLGTRTMEQMVVAGDMRVEGDPRKLAAFASWLDTPPFWFNIVTP